MHTYSFQTIFHDCMKDDLQVIDLKLLFSIQHSIPPTDLIGDISMRILRMSDVSKIENRPVTPLWDSYSKLTSSSSCWHPVCIFIYSVH